MTDAVPVPLAVAPPFASPSPPSVPRVALSSADGSLSFDFAPRVGLQLRLTSWRDGLQLSRFEDGAWEPEPSDPQLIRPADFLARSRGDPLAQFAATLPAEECSLASRFQSWQLTILRLLRCHPAAAVLFRPGHAKITGGPYLVLPLPQEFQLPLIPHFHKSLR